jgi:hypothetical protein
MSAWLQSASVRPPTSQMQFGGAAPTTLAEMLPALPHALGESDCQAVRAHMWTAALTTFLGIGRASVGCKSHVDMSATTTVALPTKREHPHCGRERSHEGTPPESVHSKEPHCWDLRTAGCMPDVMSGPDNGWQEVCLSTEPHRRIEALYDILCRHVIP